MPTYRWADLHHGMNKYSQAESLGPAEVQDAIGVDISKPGVLGVLPGGKLLSANIAGVVCKETAWVGGIFTIYYTTAAGLYRLTDWSGGTELGTKISTAITGEFSVAVLNNIAYIASSTARLRDDGTTCTTWGVTAPVAAPTLSLVAQLTRSIEPFETATSWTSSNCTLANETTIIVGTGTSLKITLGSGSQGTITKTGTWDLSTFSAAGDSNTEDFIELYAYYVGIASLSQVSITLDCNDGSFNNDGFFYTFPIDSNPGQIMSMSGGKSKEHTPIEYVPPPVPNVPTVVTIADQATLGYSTSTYTPATIYDPNAYLDQEDSTTGYDDLPRVGLRPKRKKVITVQDDNRWTRYLVRKSEFARFGSTVNKGWNTIKAISIIIRNVTGGTSVVYFDGLGMRGGGKHMGDYCGMYAFAVRDNSNNTLRVSGCSPVSSSVTAENQQITWTVGTSADTQVNQRLLFITGGVMGRWYCAGKINDNSTTTATTDIFDWEYQDVIQNYYPTDDGRNPTDANVPPALTKVATYANRIWGCGVAANPNYLYPSTINRGDDMPVLNAMVFTHKGETLKNLVSTPLYLHVRGDIQEYRASLGDWANLGSGEFLPIAGEYAAVGGRDACRLTSGAVAGVSQNGLTLSNGLETNDLSMALLDLPSSTDIANSSMASFGRYLWAGIKTADGDRTLMVDYLTGQPRACYIWDKRFTHLSANPKTKKLYGLNDGKIYELYGNYGWQLADGSAESNATWSLTTAKIGLDDRFTVSQIKLDCIGTFTLEVYMDGTLITTQSIVAASRTQKILAVGRAAYGRYLHLKMYGTTAAAASPTVYLPILVEWEGQTT